IDHMLASPNLYAAAEFDIVHMNSGQPTTSRPTDHDAIVSRLLVNTAPVATADSYAGSEDLTLVVDAQHGVVANDTDANADLLTVVLQQGPEHGALTLNADGSFSYAPGVNYNGPDSFTYLLQDPSGAQSAAKTVTLQV